MKLNQRFDVTGMTCASCSAHVHKAVSAVKGVKEVSVSLLTNSMLVSYELPATEEKICEAVAKSGYGASLPGGETKKKGQEDFEDKETPKLLRRLIASFVLLVPLFYFSMGYMNSSWGWPLGVIGENPFYFGLLQLILSSALLLINRAFFVSGFKALIHGGPNMDTLVCLGSGISYLYGFVVLFMMAGMLEPDMNTENWHAIMMKSMGLTFETAGMVPTLITIGKVLESYSKGKTTNAIKSLMDLAPKEAHVIKDGKEVTVAAESVQISDVFVVRPGESFPVDGVVLEGFSCVDESALSGESAPVDKTKGDKVSAATINQNGALTCRATRVGGETTLHQIVKMVEQASMTKTKISRLADKVSGIFVPTVLGIALLVFLGWIVLGGDYIASLGSPFDDRFAYSLERAISVLVVACPCALGLATPVAIMVGSGKGAKNGILFKTASSLEETGKIDFVVLDKTGTLTNGAPVVTDVCPFEGANEEELLSIAYALESLSEHPLAKAIRAEAEKRGVAVLPVEGFSALPGFGVQGNVAGVKCLAGKPTLFQDGFGLKKEWIEEGNRLSDQGKTPLYFAKGERVLGILAVADVLKKDSVQAVAELKSLGLTPVMLTGDNERTASYIAKQAGIECFKADVLPQGKLAWIEELKKQGKVAMIGDGINDAPALTSADVGIAIGAGSDIAIDSADVVLMKGTLLDAVAAIRLSRRTLLNIKENLFWAFFYNLIMIPIASGAFSALGLAKLKPWYGAAAMALSSVCVVVNALRLNLYHLYKGNGSLLRKKAIVPNQSLFNLSEGKGEIAMEKKELKISGMMCEHCAAHVKDALQSIPGVASVEVSLEQGKATVEVNEASDDQLLEAVKKAGYKAKVM